MKNILKYFFDKLLNFKLNFQGMANTFKIQKAENINYNSQSGLNYTDVKAVAIDVFNAYVPVLHNIAKETANERISAFCDNLQKSLTVDDIKQFRDPVVIDMSYKISRVVALRDNATVNNILINLIMQKIKGCTDLETIIISRCIDCLEKTTIAELKILTIYYLVKRELLDNTSIVILEKLFDIDLTHCEEYQSNLISNGLAHKTGGFAYVLNVKEEGENLIYKQKINKIFNYQSAFVNLKVLNIGYKLAEQYLNTLNAIYKENNNMNNVANNIC